MGQDVAHIHNENLCRLFLKKMSNHGIFRKIEATRKHFVTRNKQDPEREESYIFSHMQNPNLNICICVCDKSIKGGGERDMLIGSVTRNRKAEDRTNWR